MRRLEVHLLIFTIAALGQAPVLAQQNDTIYKQTYPAFGSNCTYPAEALTDRQEAEVSVRAQWNAQGKITSQKIVHHSGSKVLDAATEQCISNWQAPPAELTYGKPGEELGITIQWQIRPGNIENFGYYRPGVLHNCSDFYPATERKNGIEGITRVAFRIKTDGKSKDITVVRSSGNTALDEAASRCAARWKYKPALDDHHQPIEVPWQVNVIWSNDLGLENLYAEPAHNCATMLPPTPEDLAQVDWYSVLRFTFDNGHPSDINVALSSGNTKLDHAAATCLLRWQLPPEPNGTKGKIKILWRSHYDKETVRVQAQ